mmetsp:Transcript_9509/g.20976  ORF Transcript_9509/g.20976 Transcript_9509/m.20976 type:complete len:592 (-) Transcript_9509:61-1836(-)
MVVESGQRSAISMLSDTKRTQLLADLVGDARQKLEDCLGAYDVNDDVVECFEINQQTTVQRDVDEFCAYVSKICHRKDAAPARSPPRRPASDQQRRTPSSSAIGMASAFLTGQPIKPQAPRLATPESKRQRVASPSASPPVIVSPVVSPAARGHALGNGRSQLLNGHLPSAAGGAARIQVVNIVEHDYRWMNCTIAERGQALSRRLENLERRMLSDVAAQVMVSDPDVVQAQVGQITHASVVVCGRIVCDAEGKLNEHSMILEGSREMSGGKRVRLVVKDCAELTAFSGQVVAVVGRVSSNGQELHAWRVIPGLPAPAPSRPKRETALVGVAAGPYTSSSDLDFALLQSVLQRFVTDRVCCGVLLGPFLEADNQLVQSRELRCSGESLTYEAAYQKVFHVIEEFGAQHPEIRIVVVPSPLDIGVVFPVPQPPRCFPHKIWAAEKESPNVSYASNPAVVMVGSTQLYLTSCDVLSPVIHGLVQRSNSSGNRIETACKMLLHQRTLFPSTPPQPCVEPSQSHLLTFGVDEKEEVPDVFVFASKLTDLAKSVDGRVFVNPGHAVKGHVAFIHVGCTDGKDVASSTRVDVVPFAT